MKIVNTGFDGLHIMEYNSFKDNRGEFVKTIHKETFEENGLEWRYTESFYSVSAKNVIRGMHFQSSPNDHDKLVYVLQGRILDVVLDIRSYSPTFGQYFSIELSDKNRKGLFIGTGFAHGFLSLEENTIVEYHTTASQNKESEGGILWNSFNFNWPEENPILSVRDTQFDKFNLQGKYF